SKRRVGKLFGDSTLYLMHDHNVMHPRFQFRGVGTGGEVGASDDDNAISSAGEAHAAGPVVSVVDESLHVPGGGTSQRGHTPVKTHLSKRGFVGTHANCRNAAALLREGQCGSTRVAGDDHQFRF